MSTYERGMSQDERAERDALFLEVGYDDRGKLRPTSHIGSLMHQRLVHLAQAGVVWAGHMLDRAVVRGLQAEHRAWRDSRDFVQTIDGEQLVKKPAAVGLQKRLPDGTFGWQGTLWVDMHVDDVRKLIVSARKRVRADNVTINMGRRVLALMEETDKEWLRDALASVGKTLDEFLCETAA